MELKEGKILRFDHSKQTWLKTCSTANCGEHPLKSFTKTCSSRSGKVKGVAGTRSQCRDCINK